MNSVAQMEAALTALRRIANEVGASAQQTGEALATLNKRLSENAKLLDSEMAIEYESPKTRDEFRVELPHFDTSIPDFTETLAPKGTVNHEESTDPCCDELAPKQTRTLTTRICLRRDTPEAWYDTNPVLLDGEIGISRAAFATRMKLGAGNNSVTVNVEPTEE